MKYAVPSLLLCLPLAALPLGEADAAAWRWSQTSGREQITIVPDVPPTNIWNCKARARGRKPCSAD